MSSRHTVTGSPTGRPAHAARPGVPAIRVAVVLAGLAALGAATWLVAASVLKSVSPTSTTPVSASLITVTPSSPGAARP